MASHTAPGVTTFTSTSSGRVLVGKGMHPPAIVFPATPDGGSGGEPIRIPDRLLAQNLTIGGEDVRSAIEDLENQDGVGFRNVVTENIVDSSVSLSRVAPVLPASHGGTGSASQTEASAMTWRDDGTVGTSDEVTLSVPNASLRTSPALVLPLGGLVQPSQDGLTVIGPSAQPLSTLTLARVPRETVYVGGYSASSTHGFDFFQDAGGVSPVPGGRPVLRPGRSYRFVRLDGFSGTPFRVQASSSNVVRHVDTDGNEASGIVSGQFIEFSLPPCGRFLHTDFVQYVADGVPSGSYDFAIG